MLAIVLNDGPEAAISFGYDLAPWTQRRAAFTLREYDEQGRLRAAPRDVPASGTVRTAKLRRLEMTILEFVGR